MPTLDPSAINRSLGFNLDRVAQLYRRELLRALAPFELTPDQWSILAALSASRGPLTQGEVAELSFKDKHSASRMLDRMEGAGWVARAPHPDDARAVLVVPGPRSPELGRVRRVLKQHFARINAGLAPDQQEQLLNLLGQLRKHLGDELPPHEGDLP